MRSVAVKMFAASAATATAAIFFPCSNVLAFHNPAAVTRPARSMSRSPALSMAQPKASDQLPAEAKRGFIRSDRVLDIATSIPQLLFRLGSGALVDGYKCEQTSHTSCPCCALPVYCYVIVRTSSVLSLLQPYLHRRCTWSIRCYSCSLCRSSRNTEVLHTLCIGLRGVLKPGEDRVCSTYMSLSPLFTWYRHSTAVSTVVHG